MKYVVSVSKTYIHRGRHRHKQDTKKHWHVYYYDEESKFHMERINFLQAAYYKTQKIHRYKYICEECGKTFLGLVKSYKQVIECPYCFSS